MDKVKVLFVDDEKAFLEATKIYLEKTKRQNFAITPISSAREALRILRKKAFDVIISDYMMPNMDGLDFLAHLRESGNDTPFIMFTGKGREEVVIQALNLGADYYLQKGGDIRSQFLELINLIQKSVEKKRAEEALRESKERLSSFMNSATEGFVIFDSELNFLECNDFGARIFGLKREDLLGKNLVDLSPEVKESGRCEEYLKVIKTGEPFYIEDFLVHTPSLGGTHLALRAFKVGNELGIIITDITERKQAEETLRESEEKYRTLVETMNDGLGVLDANDSFTYVNDKFCEIWGFSREEILGHRIYDFLDEENLPILEEQMARRKKGKHGFYEIVWTGKGGRKVPTIVSSRPIYDAEGNYQGSVGVITNITQWKQVERALQESEEKFRTFTESAPVAIMIYQNYQCLYVNPAAEQIIDYPQEELLAMKFCDFVHPDYKEVIIEEGKKIERGEPPIRKGEYKIVTKNGSEKWVAGRMEMIEYEGKRAALISAMDITERKRMEEALRESEEKFRMISEQSLLGIIILQDGLLKYVNQAAGDIVGYPIAEILAWKENEFIEVVFSDDRTFVMEQARKKQLGEKDVVTRYSYRMLTKDRQVKWVEQYSKTILYEGRPANLAIFVDITERKQAEEALRESEERLKTLFETSPDGIVITSLDGKILDANQAYQEMLGYTLAELRTLDFQQLTPEKWHEAEAAAIKATMAGGYGVFEKEYIRKDGTIFPIALSGWIIKDKQGNPIGIGAFIRDITERKQAEQALRASEERYRDMVENINEVIYVTNGNGVLTYVSPVAELFLGYRPEEVIGRHFTEFIFPEDLQYVKKIFQRSLAGHSERHEYRVLTKTGEIRWMRTSSRRTFLGDRVVGLQGVLTDITEYKLAEEALQESEEKFRTLAEQSPNMIFINKLGRVAYANEKCVELMGYTREEFYSPAFDFLTLIASESQALIKANFERHKKGEDLPPYEYALLAKDGRRIHGLITTKLIEFEGERAILGIITDISELKQKEDQLQKEITERKRTEEALRKSEEKFRTLAEQSLTGIYILKEGKAVFANEATATICGYSREEVLAWTPEEFSQIIHPEDLSFVLEQMQKKLAGAQDVVPSYDLRLISKSGKTKWVSIHSKAIPYEGGNALMAVIVDITERKQMEEALRESEERFRSLVEATSDWIWEVDQNGIYTYASPKVKDLLGYEPVEVIGKMPFDFMPSDEAGRIARVFQDIIESRKPFAQLENLNLRKDGRYVMLETSGIPIFDPSGNFLGYRGIDRDITKRKQTEEALQRHQEQLRRQRDELEAFASTVAHDLRGKLQVIALYNELIESEHSPKIAEQIHDILLFLEKLLLLAKEGEILGELGEIDLSSLLGEIAGRISSMDPQLQVEIKELPSVIGDPIKLIQVFENLLINVVQHAEATKVEIFSEENEEEHRISIQDNGKGIPKKKQQEILESWAKKSYSNLGLMIVMKIIQAHKGNITFESKEGKGTTFTIHLPKKIRN